MVKEFKMDNNAKTNNYSINNNINCQTDNINNNDINYIIYSQI